MSAITSVLFISDNVVLVRLLIARWRASNWIQMMGGVGAAVRMLVGRRMWGEEIGTADRTMPKIETAYQWVAMIETPR